MKRLIILILTVFLIISSICFSQTKGFITDISTEYFLDYCNEYQDSLANDNIIIEIGKIAFLIIFILQLVLIKKRISLVEIIIYLLICVFQTFLIFEVQSDGCSITKTIAYTKNISLLIYISVFILFFVYNVALLICNCREKI